MWNEYGEWSSCTKTCGGGTRFRSRSKHIEDSNGGDKCTGSERQDEDCNNDECIGILVDYIFCFEIKLDDCNLIRRVMQIFYLNLDDVCS